VIRPSEPFCLWASYFVTFMMVATSGAWTILTGFGLGHLLHYGRELNAMDQVIGVMFVIVVIGLLADKILFSP
jgi:ABC-type nitrate/sulfonate/bicarbonate transport system permease component